VFLLEDLEGFVVSCVLFLGIGGDPGQLYPESGLQGGLGLFDAADCLQLVLAQLAHEGHLCLPQSFLKGLGD
jgi:hypothetical protein